MGALLAIRRIHVQGIGQTVAVTERSFSGTGHWGRALHLLNVGDLRNPFWSGDVYEYCSGCPGDMRLIEHSVFFLDLDGDGVLELLDVKSTHTGDTFVRSVLAYPQVQCTVFAYDRATHRFRPQPAIQPELLYPALPKYRISKSLAGRTNGMDNATQRTASDSRMTNARRIPEQLGVGRFDPPCSGNVRHRKGGSIDPP